MIRLFHRLSAGFESVSRFFLMTAAYIIGIGITSVIGKIVGKQFLHHHVQKTAWVTHKPGNDDMTSMYS